MNRHGEAMRRVLPGLYSGDEVRAERRDDGYWSFEMKCNQLGRQLWFEFSPHGLWTSIGAWRTLDQGLSIAARLRAGSHFWDSRNELARIYTEEIFGPPRSTMTIAARPKERGRVRAIR
jgi:hypothetical protein